MKIKAVCETTGLTDRTVRYYIEEGLISPSFTENYLGRKSFDFTSEDVDALNHIATLRRFDFSIEEIREILRDPQSSPAIIQNVKERISRELVLDQRKLASLSALKAQTAYTVTDLARELLTAPQEGTLPNDGADVSFIRRVVAIGHGALSFLAVWLPIVVGVTIVFVRSVLLEDAVVDPFRLILTLVLLVPSVLRVLASRIKLLQHRLAKRILLILCVVCIPACAWTSFGIVHACEHTWIDLSVEVPVSCAVDGRVVRSCERCRRVEIVTVPRTPHTEVVDAAAEATCTVSGLTEGKHCSVCGAVTQAQSVVPKEPHAYSTVAVKASCGADGYTRYTCSCGDSYIDDIVFATERHTFRSNGERGYRCATCALEVCEFGRADGSDSPQVTVKYYITGPIDEEKEVERTLVIYGEGDMPTYRLYYHPWRASPYLAEVQCIVLCDGILSVADGAFAALHAEDPWMGNPFEGVQQFIIKGTQLTVDPTDETMSGIVCDITYMPSRETVS